jgi:hypothetical protein
VTTQTLPARPPFTVRARAALYAALSTTLSVLGPNLRATSRATRSHLQDHIYTICGLGLISAAAFVHSTFTGLLVTGIMFLVFEWKVSE